MQGLANGGGRPSLAGRRSGAWRRISMEVSGTEMPAGDSGREPTLHEHPVEAELSASDFQVTSARFRQGQASNATVLRHGQQDVSDQGLDG